MIATFYMQLQQFLSWSSELAFKEKSEFSPDF